MKQIEKQKLIAETMETEKKRLFCFHCFGWAMQKRAKIFCKTFL